MHCYLFTMKIRLSVLLFLLVSQFAFGQEASRLQETLQTTIDSLRAATGIPGMSFSTVLPDNTVISVHSGVRDLETNAPLTPETRMLAGSTGKTFFASLALAAVDSREISLDDLIYQYLKDKPWIDSLPNARTITIGCS